MPSRWVPRARCAESERRCAPAGAPGRGAPTTFSQVERWSATRSSITVVEFRLSLSKRSVRGGVAMLDDWQKKARRVGSSTLGLRKVRGRAVGVSGSAKASISSNGRIRLWRNEDFSCGKHSMRCPANSSMPFDATLRASPDPPRRRAPGGRSSQAILPCTVERNANVERRRPRPLRALSPPSDNFDYPPPLWRGRPGPWGVGWKRTGRGLERDPLPYFGSSNLDRIPKSLA